MALCRWALLNLTIFKNQLIIDLVLRRNRYDDFIFGLVSVC